MAFDRWVILDFETASAADLKKAGAWRYAEDPTTHLICLAYSIMGGEPRPWTPHRRHEHITNELWALANDPTVLFIAHNVQFEKAIWREKMVRDLGWPDIPNERWHDTLASCAQKQIPLSLEKAGDVLHLGMKKDMAGSKLTVSLSKPEKDGNYDRDKTKLETVYRYNVQDISSEVALHRRIGWLEDDERKVWLLDQHINEKGIRLDRDYINACLEVVEKVIDPLSIEFSQITQGLKFTQRDKVLAWANERGAQLPDLRKTTLIERLDLAEDETGEVSNAVEEDIIVPLDPSVRRALTIRHLIGSAAVKKLPRMEATIAMDGRAHGTLQYHGAGPGRWAGRLFQPQNFPRGTIRANPDHVVQAIMTRDLDFISATVGDPLQAVISGLRHAICAESGNTLVVGDFAGIEARVMLALAGQHDKTELMSSGVDVYCDMATAIYRRPITKANVEERQTGKNSVLGLGFQMGVNKFHDRYCSGQPIEFAEKVVETYRKVWAPKVPKVWYGLQDAAAEAVWSGRPHEAYGIEYKVEGRWVTARLPSGRRLWYPFPRQVQDQAPWDIRELRKGWTYHATKTGHWKEIHAFGGLLAENVVQGLARDLLVHGMFNCQRAGWPIVLTVHDEIICEVPEAQADPKVLEQMMTDLPPWAIAMRVPVAAECWAGERYRK